MVLYQRDSLGKEISVNVLSRMTFSWIGDILKRGNKKPLQESDVLNQRHEDAAESLTRALENGWKREEMRENGVKIGKASLLAAIIKTFRLRFLIQVALVTISITGAILLPVFIGLLATELQNASTSGRVATAAYIYAGALGLSAMILSIFKHYYFYTSTTLGHQVRVAVMALVYQKTLRLSQKVNFVTSSHVTTLASGDCDKIANACHLLMYSVMAPIEMIVVTALSWQNIGWLSILGTGFLIGLAALQGMIAWNFIENDPAGNNATRVMNRLNGKLNTKLMSQTDERVQLMKEIVTEIRAIKINTWEWALRSLISKIRRRETKFLRLSRLIASYHQAIKFCDLPLLSFFLFTSFVFTRGALKPAAVFSTLALYSYLNFSIANILSRSCAAVSEAFVAARRIQDFLEIHEVRLQPSSRVFQESYISQPSVECFVNPGFQLESRQNSKATNVQLLSFKSLDHEEKRKLAVPVPENLDKRTKHVPRIKLMHASYTRGVGSSDVLLSNISVKLKGKSLGSIIGPAGSGKTALLLAILNELHLESGDAFVEGDIAYVPQVPWVFFGTIRDNILFGSSYEEARYWRVINACALSEDIVELPNGDLTCIGERGMTLDGGQRTRISLARAAYRNAGIYLLDDPLSAVGVKVAAHLMDKCICDLLGNSLRVLVTNHTSHVEKSNQVIMLEDGRVANQGAYPVMKNSILLSGLQDEKSIAGARLFDSQSIAHEHKNNFMGQNGGLDEAHETHDDRALGFSFWKSCFTYFKAGGSTCTLLLLVILVVSGQVIFVLCDWWLARWTNHSRADQRRLANAYIYAGMVGAAIIFAFSRASATNFLLLKASCALHDNMVTALLKAPVLFFDTNHTGRILSRFSKDVSCTDGSLPNALIESLHGILFLSAVVILAVAVNYWVILGAIPLVVALVFLRRYVLRSTRDLNRLEAARRRPILSHYSETLEGLTSLRVYGAQEWFTAELYKMLDNRTRPYIMLLAAHRWLSLRVDLLCSTFITVVAFVAVLTAADPGYTALSLMYAIRLTNLVDRILHTTSETESHVTSAERVMHYGNLESEPGYALESRPPPLWPSDGKLTCVNLCLAYYEGGTQVLRDIFLEVRPREKIAVVGRTGSGKTSLVSAFLRMPQPEGTILIDGVDVGQLNLQDSRRVISVIPQEPVLFTGSLRFNLDPLKTCGNEILWDALEKVNLKTKVTDLPGGLSYYLHQGESHFGNGEKQLLSLARTLLQNNKIVFINEAPACVDMATDGLIQETIRTQFQDRTVITIARRLETILQCDRVIVLREGRVVEFDEPDKLVDLEEEDLNDAIQ